MENFPASGVFFVATLAFLFQLIEATKSHDGDLRRTYHPDSISAYTVKLCTPHQPYSVKRVLTNPQKRPSSNHQPITAYKNPRPRCIIPRLHSCLIRHFFSSEVPTSITTRWIKSSFLLLFLRKVSSRLF